jgi:hypothetical protein
METVQAKDFRMTILTSIPASGAPSIEEILQRGVCAACHKPLVGHVNPETKAWELCANVPNNSELPQTEPHPLRRATDILVMVPLTLLSDGGLIPALLTGVTPQHVEDRQESQTSQRRAAPRQTRYPTRGKPAGRYVAIPDKPPTRMTESINRVWFAMKGSKRGVVAKQLAERLNMSDGTLAWVLAQLVKQGSIVHVRPGEMAPGEKSRA